MARAMKGAMVALALFGLLSVVAAAAGGEDTDVCNLNKLNYESLKGSCDVGTNFGRGGQFKEGECCSKIDALMSEVLENSRFNQECGVQFLAKLATNGYPMIAINYVNMCLGEERRALAESSDPSQTQPPNNPNPNKPAPKSNFAPASAIPILMQLAFAFVVIALLR